MNKLMSFLLIIAFFSGCGTADENTQVKSSRAVPPRGTINEFGQIKITQPTARSYALEVIPFVRNAIYKVVISESRETSAECELFPTEEAQTLKVEKNNLDKHFLHFVRVCVYFDEGDSGASHLVLVNDQLLVGISPETVNHY